MSEYVTEPARLSNKSIEEYAERVGRHHHIYDWDGRADIDAFLARLGGDVRYAQQDESLQVRADGRFTIFIPHFTSSRRDRFTIAHELGHYFLHYLYPKRQGEIWFGRGGTDRAETEANVFASTLLMPADDFRRAYREVGGDIWKLAALFDVSPKAAEVRASVLGLR